MFQTNDDSKLLDYVLGGKGTNRQDAKVAERIETLKRRASAPEFCGSWVFLAYLATRRLVLRNEKGRHVEWRPLNQCCEKLLENDVESGSELAGKVAVRIESANRLACIAVLIDDYE